MGASMMQEMLDCICTSLDILMFYESKAGIKCFYETSHRNMLGNVSSREDRFISAESLSMCMDRLEDSHTSLSAKPPGGPRL
jgi:hypothetical protein